MTTAVIQSPLGHIKIQEENNSITRIEFCTEELQSAENDLLKKAEDEIQAYFKGKKKSFSFEISPQGTKFQKEVWQELLRIPYGETISYLELANRLGDPKSIRAAASANGRNPIAIVVPCHRVIGTDGSMTGYAGGLERKRALLTLEGAEVMSQMSIF